MRASGVSALAFAPGTRLGPSEIRAIADLGGMG